MGNSMFAKLRDDEVDTTTAEERAAVQSTNPDFAVFAKAFPNLALAELARQFNGGKRFNPKKAELERERMIHALRVVHGD